MAVQTISTNKFATLNNTPVLTLQAGDTLNLLPNAGLFNYRDGTANGVDAAGANSLALNGDVFSLNAIGLNFAGGNNDINIGAASSVFGATMGMAIAGNNNSIGVAGHVVGATQAAIAINGTSNTLNLLAGSTVQGGYNAIQAMGNGGNKITIAGEVTGWNIALLLQGGSNVVTVESTGRVVTSAYCVNFDAGGTGANQLINHGVMQSGNPSYVVLSNQPGTFVYNTGTMIGTVIGLTGVGATPGTKNTVINSGVIATPSDNNSITMATGSGVDEIVNTGTILG
jgi:hypothetical protein